MNRGSTQQQQQETKQPLFTQMRQERLTPETKTLMLECNKQTSIDSKSNKDNWRWTTEFPSGVELLAGDMIRMSSSYVNSIGVGDLIRFNLKGDEINNKATWIQSYYGIDDGINQKREGYNMRTDSNLEGGLGLFAFDSTNRPARLERNTQSYDLQNSTRTNAYNKVSWYQDPYLKCRFYGTTIGLQTPEYEDMLLQVDVDNTDTYSYIKLNIYDSGTATIVSYDARKIFSVGQQILIKADNHPVYGTLYFKTMLDTRLSIIDFIFVSGQWCLVVEQLFPSLAVTSGFSNYISGNIKVVNGDSRMDTSDIPYASFYALNRIIYKYENENNSTTPQEYYAVQIKTIDTFDDGLLNINSKTTILKDDDNEIIKCYISTDDVYKRDIIDQQDFQVLNLAVGGDTSRIQIKFINNEASSTNGLLELRTRNLGNSLCLYVPRPDGTTEIITITNFYYTDYAETTINSTFDGSSTFTFYNCKRNIDLRQSTYPGTVNTTIPSTYKLTFFSRIGATNYNYYFNPFKKQYLESSIDQSIITPITREPKIYYGIIKKTEGNEFEGVSDNSSSFENSIWGLLETTTGDIYQGVMLYINGPSITNPIQQVIHFNTFNYEIDQEYNSPSDVASKLTEKTHLGTDNRNKYGEIVTDSKNKGMISNNLFFPVYSSNNSGNTENATTGKMNGDFDNGSFQLLSPYYKAGPSVFNASHYPDNGLYHIYFRTNKMSINVPHVHAGLLLPDFNQSADPYYSTTYGPTSSDIIGFPITNILDENNEQLISQYIGSNNVSFAWNTAKSRFQISYLHQPYTSTYTQAGTGGNISAKIYFPNPLGKDNYPYKVPMTRIGGVNIEHWYSKDLQSYNVPNDVYNDFTTKAFFDDLDGDEFFLDLNENADEIGKRFWNKLGFSDYQLENLRGVETDPTSGYYNMLGTTGNPNSILDTADGLPIASNNSVNFPFYFTLGEFETTGIVEEARYKYSSVGSLNINSASLGYSIPSATAGAPIEYKPNSAIPADFNPLQTTFNVDREIKPYFTISIESDSLTANDLPTKQENPYYLLVSDIVDSNFMVSKNGINYNVVGIISKLNFASDFIFGYTSPISYFIKKDRILNTINVEIRNPDLSPATDINNNSSIIFEVVRNLPNTLPDNLPTPIWYKQERMYNKIEEYKQLITKQLQQEDKSKAERIEQILEELNQALIKPDENQSELLNRIISNYQRIGLKKFKNSPTEMKNLLIEHPLAQEFLNDLETYKNLRNIPNRLPSDLQSVDPETLENFLYSQGAYIPEEERTGYEIQNTEEQNNQAILNEMARFMHETTQDENLSYFDQKMVEDILTSTNEETDSYDKIFSLFDKKYSDLTDDEKKMYNRYYQRYTKPPKHQNITEYNKDFVEKTKEEVEQETKYVPEEDIEKLLEETKEQFHL